MKPSDGMHATARTDTPDATGPNGADHCTTCAAASRAPADYAARWEPTLLFSAPERMLVTAKITEANMLEGLWTLENLVALVTLAGLEIVLGIDNIVFVVVITNKLPEAVRATARRLGIGLAMITRLALLLVISAIMGLTAPLFSIFDHVVSGRDLVLLAGGLFLLAKATHEIHDKLEEPDGRGSMVRASHSYAGAIIQILLLDLVFSLDSVITAVGMAQHLAVMVAAIVIAVGVMLFFAGAIGAFVSAHPTVQMLAFSFLLLVGIFLVAEGLHRHIDRGYIYFAMAFSLFVEFLNLRIKKKRQRAAQTAT
jgi:predicted tellurium resistance membrane protein TerC